MLRALAGLFSKGDPLTASARQPDRAAFVRALLKADVTVLAALRSEGLDAGSYTQEELLAAIEAAARDLSERDSFEPFVYEQEGLRRLPFFSTARHAETFCGEYSKERHRVFPFQTLSVKGAVLASVLPACDVLVLNARTADEYLLTAEVVELLRQV